MSRMADRIQTGTVHPPSWQAQDWTKADFARMRDGLRMLLRAVPIVVADNVCEYLYAGTDQEEWKIESDFPTLAPPFPSFWLEMRRPSKIISTEYGERSSRNMGYAWGYFVEAIPPDAAVQTLSEEIARGDVAGLRKMVDGSAAFLHEGIMRKWAAAREDMDRFWHSLDVSEQALMVNTELLRQVKQGDGGRWVEQLRSTLDKQRVKWVMRADLWIEPEKGVIVGPLVNHTFLLDDQGRPVMALLFHLYMTDGSARQADVIKPHLEKLSTAIFPACLTLSFFHCKNVTVRQEQPPVALAKAHIRRHGIPLLRYHTLDIRPMQRVLRHEGQSEGHGLARALHICRGHFKDFRQKGLFGKHFGMYWWDMHIRGNRAAGIVHKDYAMHAPQP
jgi:hypothetical protein